MRGIRCLVGCVGPSVSDSTLTGGYPIIPHPVSAIDLSLRTHFRRFYGLRITLWRTGLGASPAPGGSVTTCKKQKRRNIVLIPWMWGSGFDTTVWACMRRSNQKFLVNYCPLVFIPLLCWRFLGSTHLHHKLLLTGDVDPLFGGVTVRLTCVAYLSTKSRLFHKGLSHTFNRRTPVLFFFPSFKEHLETISRLIKSWFRCQA